MGELIGKSITAAELEQLCHACNDQINSGTLVEHERCKRSDAGTKHCKHTPWEVQEDAKQDVHTGRWWY